jgi:hypothetical protein
MSLQLRCILRVHLSRFIALPPRLTYSIERILQEVVETCVPVPLPPFLLCLLATQTIPPPDCCSATRCCAHYVTDCALTP